MIFDLGVYVLVNRNPSISVGSILLLKVGKVQFHVENFTLGISNNILPLIAGDYDGDVINIIALFETNLIKKMERFKPSNLLYLNNEFNTKLSLEKDQILGIKQFLNN